MDSASRIIAVGIVPILIIAFIIAAFFLTQPPGIVVRLCSSSEVRTILTSLSWKGCGVEEGRVSPGTISVGTTVTPVVSTNTTEQGLLCPSVAKQGTPIVISWSCGAARLSAVAGFELTDRTRTSLTVVPDAPDTTYGIRCSDGYQTLCHVDTTEPQVSIWADPQRVRLGSRTNIFWDSTDVQSCRVTGPSFDESTTSGGGSTVPITTASTFTIVCVTNGGGVAEASVRVDFAQ